MTPFNSNTTVQEEPRPAGKSARSAALSFTGWIVIRPQRDGGDNGPRPASLVNPRRPRNPHQPAPSVAARVVQEAQQQEVQLCSH